MRPSSQKKAKEATIRLEMEENEVGWDDLRRCGVIEYGLVVPG